MDYHTNSKYCYFSNHHGEPEIFASGFQSAHSLGCSGACDGQTAYGSCGSQHHLSDIGTALKLEVDDDDELSGQVDDRSWTLVSWKLFYLGRLVC